ncbi:hypothetical protein ACFPRL_18425 [Pseudoclavibacter helvolus]
MRAAAGPAPSCEHESRSERDDTAAQEPRSSRERTRRHRSAAHRDPPEGRATVVQGHRR